LNTEGFILHLGHGGRPCPANIALATQAEVADDVEEEILMEAWEPRDKRTLVIVDVSRIHQLMVSWCCCKGCPDYETQLFEHGLFPASTTRTSTAFTFSVLEYFHVDAVECKTSASNFSNKLHQLTDFSSPQSVPVSMACLYYNIFLIGLKDRYHELMRVSRIWRDLMARINSGLGHEEIAELQPGGLAIFCPACPQPGVNLPKEWDRDPKRYQSSLYNLLIIKHS